MIIYFRSSVLAEAKSNYKDTAFVFFAVLAKDDFKKAQIKQKNVRHTNLLSRRHFEAVPECCAQSLPVAASVTAPLKIPAQFDKLLLSPSSRGNTALQRRYSTAMSPLLPRYVPGIGGPWFTLTGA